MNTPNYDIDYFINFFTAIPDEKWCAGALELDGRHCALGHCTPGHKEGDLWPPAALALNSIAAVAPPCKSPLKAIAAINDGCNPAYRQATPKQRVLAFLADCKAKAEAELDRYELRELKLSATIAAPAGQEVVA